MAGAEISIGCADLVGLVGWWEAPENMPLSLKGPVHRASRKRRVGVEIHKDGPSI